MHISIGFLIGENVLHWIYDIEYKLCVVSAVKILKLQLGTRNHSRTKKQMVMGKMKDKKGLSFVGIELMFHVPTYPQSDYINLSRLHVVLNGENSMIITGFWKLITR